jgi:demethylmenaquinone methyltransferase/2-methoxy-6-polyprenyl-1,4-benzoquinol methylase
MRWLEGTPGRYDAGMRAITFGRVDALHDAVADAAAPRPGARVLEVGCGTGAVTERLRARGAIVTALDASAEMLEQARARIGDDPAVEWVERTASEIDELPPGEFDAVVFSLSLSEMSNDERRYALAAARERLAPGGRVLVADEVRATGPLRALQLAARAPQALLAWMLVGTVSRVLPDLRGELEAARLRVCSERRWLAGTLALFCAEPAT